MFRLRIEWINRNQWISWMRQRGSEAKTQMLEDAVGRAAIRVQGEMRENLQRMVYSQPPSAANYIRTFSLMRSTHAASPEVNHAGDTGRAMGGEDLAADSPSAAVGRRGTQIMSEVGSWIAYAEHVHRGTNAPARPFVQAAEPFARRVLQEEVERAVKHLMAA